LTTEWCHVEEIVRIEEEIQAALVGLSTYGTPGRPRAGTHSSPGSSPLGNQIFPALNSVAAYS
jgi:hypothetical protein